MQNLNLTTTDIFSMDADALIQKTESVDSEIYKPSIDKEKVDKYTALIKFLPWHKDWTKSRISKWQVFLKNNDTEEFKMVDCPSTVKEKSILQDIFFTLKNSPHADLQELKENFSRKSINFSLVQIIKDKQHPELEGKIKVFSYGKKIADKIDNVLKPTDDGISEPNNPFDIFEGKVFSLSIKKIDKYPNYDDSAFLDKTYPLLIKDEKIQEKNKNNISKVLKFLQEESPDLEKYEYKAWSKDVKDFVIQSIKSILPDGVFRSQVLKRNQEFFNGYDIKENNKEKINKIIDDEEEKSIDDIDAYLSSKNTKIDIDDIDDEEEVDIKNKSIIDDDEDEIDKFLSNEKSKNNKKVKNVDFL